MRVSIQNQITYTLNVQQTLNLKLFFSAFSTPFRLEFFSDGYEIAIAANEGSHTPSTKTTEGAKVQFFQTAC